MWQMLNGWLDSIDAVTGSGSATFAIILAFIYLVFCVIIALIYRQAHNAHMRIMKRFQEIIDRMR